MEPLKDFLPFGSWEALKELGRGGQGTVYLARKRIEPLASPDLPDQFANWIHGVTAVNPEHKKASARSIFTLIRQFCDEQNAPFAAIKELHDKTPGAKALERMNRELAVLTTCVHPSLVRVFDTHLGEGWFAMEYFHSGPLSNYPERFRGDMLASLIAFRPLVEAVAHLHKNGIVHRDIKPENVFIGDDGRLVLGDCGLVIEVDARVGRVTDTYENVGSRDWMPGWAMGMRIEEVTPAFDVFCLGKLLWAMVSGRSRLRLWYHHDPEFELEQMFPHDPAIRWARHILDKCIVEREHECIANAGDLLNRLDTFIGGIKRYGQLPGDGPVRCRICGLGEYTETVRSDPGFLILACNSCGNTQSFHKPENRAAWQTRPRSTRA